MEQKAPKVFVSHASEDKERFVVPFATRLRAKGIDAWVDKWEMLPGDSLVDKIFEEGLKEATAVVIVLSSASVKKPWVREELNASVVSHIDKGTRLIPVVIDKCEVPEALKSTVWQVVDDISSYDEAFERILASILGMSLKPPLGERPAYAAPLEHSIPGLTLMDNRILKLSGEAAVAEGDLHLEPSAVFIEGTSSAVPESELVESIDVLESLGYVKVTRFLSGSLFPFELTTYGFTQFAQTWISDFPVVVREVAAAVVNERLHGDEEVAQHVQQPLFMVRQVLKLFASHDHIKISETLSESCSVYHVSPSLKRTYLS